MPEHDALVRTYSHLGDFPRAADALHLLRRVASLVKPLMRARAWRVRELSEFFPDQANLLGLNINRGQKILLRLRYPNDASLFLPLEQIADTMLHELAHIVHGPHDATFHALWNQLRDEHVALTIKGFTGDAFLSDGHRLGSSSQTKRSERRQSTKTSTTTKTSATASSIFGSLGRRLGGPGSAPAETAKDLRRVVAEAVARRNSHTPQTLGGCATDGPQYNDQARAVLVAQASRNGFRTQADEDAANDAAIAQALWELVQDDERQRLGARYVPPTAERPQGSGGWLTAQGDGLSTSPIVIDDCDGRDDGGDDCDRDRRRTRPSRKPVPPSTTLTWSCHVCTLQNPSTYLCCDACSTERPSSDPARPATVPPPTTRPSSRAPPPPPPPPPLLPPRPRRSAGHDRPKKKVHFTPSTHGGSVTAATSSSRRVRPPTPPGSVTFRSGHPASVATDAPPQTWMCTQCWAHSDQSLVRCGQCSRPRQPVY